MRKEIDLANKSCSFGSGTQEYSLQEKQPKHIISFNEYICNNSSVPHMLLVSVNTAMNKSTKICVPI